MSGIYSHLTDQQIRVLELHSGTFHDEICISLLPQDLEDETNEPYEAVSYVWGKPELTKLIRCDKNNISVTENVHELLCYLRLPDTSRRLWIDAICINQTSDERSNQVSMMHRVYGIASRVLIWLGPDESDTGSLNLLFEELQAQPQMGTRLSPWALVEKRNLVSDRSYHPRMHDSNIVSGRSVYTELTRSEISVLRHFARNSWFHRAWTFQEACLASDAKVICGHFSFPWIRVLKAVQKLASQGCLQTAFGSAADSMAALAYYSTRTAQESGTKPEILNILRLVRNRQATDDRDKIFSVLGLFHNDSDLGISPDYDEGPREVYIQCVRIILNRHGNLALLSCCLWPAKSQRRFDFRRGPGWEPTQSPTLDLRLPSWVPDWRIQRHVAGLRRFALSNDQEYFQKLPTHHDTNDISDFVVTEENTLRQRGVFRGIVSSVDSADGFLDTLNNTENPFMEKDHFDLHFGGLSREVCFGKDYLQLLSSLSLEAVYAPTGERSHVALVRALAANRLPVATDMRKCVRHIAEIAYESLKNLLSGVEALLTHLPHDSERLSSIKDYIQKLDADGKLEDYNLTIRNCYSTLEKAWQENRLPTRTHWHYNRLPWRHYVNNKESELRTAAVWMETLIPYLHAASEESKGSSRNMQDLRDFLIACDIACTPLWDTLDTKSWPNPGLGMSPFTRHLFFYRFRRHDKTMHRLGSAIETFSAFRHVFSIDNGWIGLGPDYMDKGDEVWDLNGAEVPFILRREDSREQRDGERRYRLVGECYVHGVTKGEPWADVFDQRDHSLSNDGEMVKNIEII